MSHPSLLEYHTPLLSAVVSLANRSAPAVCAKERQTLATSGRRCLGLFESSTPLGYLVKTLLTSRVWHSTRRYLTWKITATKQLHLICQLVASMPGIKGNVCLSLLPTPDTCPEAPNKSCNRKYPKNLLQAAQDNFVPELLPTPSALNGHNCGTFQEWGGAWNKLRGSPLASGKVNPVWEEWLMGFPKDWTNLDDKAVATLSETQSSRSKSTRSSKRLQTAKEGSE